MRVLQAGSKFTHRTARQKGGSNMFLPGRRGQFMCNRSRTRSQHSRVLWDSSRTPRTSRGLNRAAARAASPSKEIEMRVGSIFPHRFYMQRAVASSCPVPRLQETQEFSNLR